MFQISAEWTLDSQHASATLYNDDSDVHVGAYECVSVWVLYLFAGSVSTDEMRPVEVKSY